MKIGISATGKDLSAQVDQRFGRCHYFLIVDTENMNYEHISNDSAMVSGGAGIKAAQLIAKTGVKAVLTGNMGPNAFQTLSAAKIKIYTGATGTIEEVINKFKKGKLKETSAPNVGSHSGMPGAGRRLGRGRNL